MTVKGDVDIVAGMREQGLYAHSRDGGFGDRLAVARIAYEIRSEATKQARTYASFDFKRMAIKDSYTQSDFNTEQTKVLYKHAALFDPEKRSGNKTPTYYAITQCPQGAPPRELKPEFAQNAWRTAELGADGKPLFPDGAYEVVVTAWDFGGRSASASTRVEVKNSIASK